MAARPHLLFVYNADSGIVNALRDAWHKVTSPQTYDCQLCAVTYGPVAMRPQWRAFVRGLDADVTFLHRDELRTRYGVTAAALPAAFTEEGGALREWLPAGDLRAVEDLDALMALVRARWPEGASLP